MRKKTKETDTPVQPGTLYLVSIPIGNDDDITLRALKVLKSVDIVVCEEAKIGARTLHKYNLVQKMELLNEQNESKKTDAVMELLLEGKNIALISDCGTPVFADPGLELVQRVLAKNLNLSVIPGPSSLMTAIIRSGFDISQFVFGGFLSKSKEERILQMRNLSTDAKTIVLFETPYRIIPLLSAARTVMPDRKAYVGCNLTYSFETNHYGTFTELYEKFNENKFKGEFIIVFEGATLEEIKNPAPIVQTPSTVTITPKSKSYYEDEDEDEDSQFNRIGKILKGAYYSDEELMDLKNDNKNSKFSKSRNPKKPGGPPSYKKSSGGGYGKPKGYSQQGKTGGSYKSGGEGGNYKSSDSNRGGFGKGKPFASKGKGPGNYSSGSSDNKQFRSEGGSGSYSKSRPDFKKRSTGDGPKKFIGRPPRNQE